MNHISLGYKGSCLTIRKFHNSFISLSNVTAVRNSCNNICCYYISSVTTFATTAPNLIIYYCSTAYCYQISVALTPHNKTDVNHE